VLARLIRQRKPDKWCFIYAGAAVIGLVPVLFMIKYYTGNPFSFFQVQKDWGRGLSPPWTTVANGFDNLCTPETIMVPALVAELRPVEHPDHAFGVAWAWPARRSSRRPGCRRRAHRAAAVLHVVGGFSRFVLADG
jgi:hypothetical protein